MAKDFYENGNALMAFIEKQKKDWDIHRKEIGLFSRFFENIFGSSFAHQQCIEFKSFCEAHGFKSNL